MKYFLVDENKVRSILELEILLRGKVKSADIFNVDFLVTAYDVNFKIRQYNLKVHSVEPASEKAYAITTEGLIRWKNQYRKIYEGYDLKTYSSSEIYNFGVIDLYNVFCSGYICLGKTPSDNALKFTGKDIKVVDDYTNKIYSPDDAGLKITETNDFLILEVNEHKVSGSYAIGPVINDKFYEIISFDEFERSIKLTIPRGTCFKTYLVAKNISSEKHPIEGEKPAHELCY